MTEEWVCCRACNGKLTDLLSLGQICLSTFLGPGDPDPPAIPIDLMICAQCDLVQLRHTIHPDTLYRKYWYRSGVNEVMQEELRSVVKQALAFVGPLQGSDQVVDIGANDGTLLSHYKGCSPKLPLRIAFEPAYNLHKTLHPHAEVLISDYFPGALSRGQCQAKIITSIAMFYDLDDPHKFVQAIKELLAPGGVWIVQFQDLWSMVEATAFDNLVHEHLCYYSLKTFEALLPVHGLQVIHSEPRAINGGSLRIIVGHTPPTWSLVSPGLEAMRQREITYDDLQLFAHRVTVRKWQLRGLLEGLQAAGKIVDLYAASTKAQTLLQYCQITPDLIRWAVERSPEKVGKRLVGSGIPIVSEDTWRNSYSDAALIGAWQFAEAFLARESAYLAQGGSFILPLPEVEVIC